MPRFVSIEDVVRQPGAAGFDQELVAEADQPTRRDGEVHPRAPMAVVHHLLHTSLADSHELRHCAQVRFRHVNPQPLHRLMQLAIDGLRDHLRLPDGQLESLAPHRLDQHRQLQLTAALHYPGVRTFGGQHPDGDIADHLPRQAILQQPRC